MCKSRLCGAVRLSVRLCACVCISWQLLRYFFLNSDKAGISVAHYALALPRCAHTLAVARGIISHFPYLSMTLCVRAHPCLCELRLLSMWQMGFHCSGSHGGGGKSLFGCNNLHTSQGFFGWGKFLLNWTNPRSVQEHWQAESECSSSKLCQIRAEVGQSKPSLGPKSQCREWDFNNM